MSPVDDARWVPADLCRRSGVAVLLPGPAAGLVSRDELSDVSIAACINRDDPLCFELGAVLAR